MASEIRQLFAIAIRQSAAIASLVVRAEGVCGGSRDVQPSEDAVLAAMANLSGHNSGHGGEIPKIPSRSLGAEVRGEKGGNWFARRDSNSRPIAPEAIQTTLYHAESVRCSRSKAALYGTIGVN